MEKAVAETNRINGRKFNLDLNKYGIPIAFVIMMIVLTFLSDRFLTLNNIRNVLRQSSILFIVACGQTLVLLTSGIDLSQGSVISLVSMTTALSLCKYGLVPGVIIGILTGLACGSVTGLLVGKAKLLPFVASLAMQYIADGLALISNNGLPVTNIPGNVINKFCNRRRLCRLVPGTVNYCDCRLFNLVFCSEKPNWADIYMRWAVIKRRHGYPD